MPLHLTGLLSSSAQISWSWKFKLTWFWMQTFCWIKFVAVPGGFSRCRGHTSGWLFTLNPVQETSKTLHPVSLSSKQFVNNAFALGIASSGPKLTFLDLKQTDEIWSITGQKLIRKIETGSSSSNMHLNFPLQEIIMNWIDELLGEGAPLVSDRWRAFWADWHGALQGPSTRLACYFWNN